MEQLVINNIDKNLTLGNVLKEHGVNFIDFKKYWVMSNIELIGSGQFGKVFDIGNDKILKISKDIYEYNALIYLKNELIFCLSSILIEGFFIKTLPTNVFVLKIFFTEIPKFVLQSIFEIIMYSTASTNLLVR